MPTTTTTLELPNGFSLELLHVSHWEGDTALEATVSVGGECVRLAGWLPHQRIDNAATLALFITEAVEVATDFGR